MPSSYQALYTQEVNYVTSFNATLAAGGTGTTYPVLYTGTLKPADANSGPQLINSGYMAGVQVQLQALKAMGVQAIMVQVGFPMLYEPFLTAQGQSQTSFVTFYQQVAQMVHAQGMKLIVENDTLLSNDDEAGWDTAPFYQTLDWTTYQQARAADALTVVQTMQPDYLVVLEEPDTEAMNTGQSNVNTSAGANSMLTQILAGLQTSRQAGLKVGAGVGTWLYGFQSFIQDFVAQPLDFIDMHIYPINDSFLPNSLTIASMAASAGLPVAMSEFWMNKELDSEVGVAATDEVRARNVFSFWGPLDASFLQTIQTLANNTQMLFLAPCDSEYFFAYQTYDDSTSGMPAADLTAQENSLASQNSAAAQYTSTASSFYTDIIPSPDSTPPTTPTGVAGVSGNPTTANITWNLSTDNVGVAGYYVLRNGQVVGTTDQVLPATPPPSNTIVYTDSGLTEATTYNYSVEAFDMAGNVSLPSAPIPVMTDDNTPPTAPATLTVTPASCYSVSLSWSPSTDNTQVGQYLILWGLSPGSLIQVANTYGTMTTATYSSLSPGTTYYFAIEAEDNYKNVSLSSPVVAVTMPALPTPPATVAASPISTSKMSVSWSAASGGLAIANYHVYRGTSASNLAQIAVTTNTSYTDATASPSTTYYYAIQAADTGMPPDLSMLSSAAQGTTYAAPGAPTGFTATAQATTRIGLCWNASASGGLPISNYHVYRGASPSTLTQLTVTTKTSFTDTTVSPATTYYYAVEAADTASDLSAFSATVSANTYSGPSAPVVTATPSSASKIVLTWNTPSGGGLAIGSYHVYEGASPSSLSQVATLKTTSYTAASLTAATTYYFAVSAVDTGGDVSPLSATISAATYALPSKPANVATQTNSSSKITVTWSASTGSLAISAYRIYEGTSPGSLSQVASLNKTSYTASSLAAGTTYYFAVAAVDTAGDVSVQSAAVSGATYVVPTTPANVSAQGTSSKQITVGWSASTGSVAIGHYNVLRGTSPGSLGQIAQTTNLSFKDNTATSGVTYYYAVQAADTAADLSQTSAPVAATTQ